MVKMTHKKESNEMPGGIKICCKCKIEKNETEFTSSELKKKNSRCKSCRSKYSKQQAETRPIKEKAICYICIMEKPAVSFSPSELKKKNSKCMNCCSEYNKQRKKENPEKIKETNRKNNVKYREKNSIKIKKNRNKEKINKRQRERRQIDLNYKIRSNISTMVWAMLQSQKSSKYGQSCLPYLPYTILEFKKWIENLFEPWMTWKNQGRYNKKTWNDNDMKTWTWQLDHIIPQSDLPYDSMDHENFKKAWSLSNLRPLSAKQNQLDGAQRTRHKKKDK